MDLGSHTATQTIVGGSALQMGYAVENENNVTINSGNYAGRIAAGSWLTGWEDGSGRATATTKKTNLVINDGTFERYIVGGHVIGNNGQTATLDEANVTIKGGETTETEAYIATAGHIIKGGNMTVGAANIDISGGTFAGSVIGGVWDDTVHDNTSRVKVGDISMNLTGGTYNGWVTGGGYMMGSGGVTTAEYGDITITVDGGVLNSNMYGGCRLDREGCTLTQGNIVINLVDGSLGGNLYAGGNQQIGMDDTTSMTAESTTVAISDEFQLMDDCKVSGYACIHSELTDSAQWSTVGKSTLKFTGAAGQDCTNVTFTHFDEIVVEQASATSILGNVNGTNITKSGAGTLEATTGFTALSVAVNEGTLALSGSTSIAAISVNAGGTLDTSAAGATHAGGITLNGGTVVVDANGAGLAIGSYITIAEKTALTLEGLALPENGDTVINLFTNVGALLKGDYSELVLADTKASEYFDIAGLTEAQLANTYVQYVDNKLQLLIENLDPIYWEGTGSDWGTKRGEDQNWSGDTSGSSLTHFRPGASVIFDNATGADITIDTTDEKVVVNNMTISAGEYSFTNADKLSISGKLGVDNATANFDTLNVTNTGSSTEIGAAGTVNVSGDAALGSVAITDGGKLDVEGKLTFTGDVAVGGTVEAGSIELGGTNNSFGNLTVPTLEVAATDTLTAAGTLTVDTLTITGITTAGTGITADSVATLTPDGTLTLNLGITEADILSWGLVNGQTVTLIGGLTTQYTGNLAWDVNGQTYFTEKGYDYTLKATANSIVITAKPEGNEWTSTDGIWGSDSSWGYGVTPTEDTIAALLGNGTSTVKLADDVAAKALIVDTGLAPTTEAYELTADEQHTLTTEAITITKGDLTIGENVTADVSGETSVGNGTLTVEGTLNTGSLSLTNAEKSGFTNSGTTVVEGVLSAAGHSITNSGSLSVGSGSSIGTLENAGGSLAAAGLIDLGTVNGGSVSLTDAEAGIGALNDASLTATGSTIDLGAARNSTIDMVGGSLALDASTVEGLKLITNGTDIALNNVDAAGNVIGLDLTPGSELAGGSITLTMDAAKLYDDTAEALLGNATLEGVDITLSTANKESLEALIGSHTETTDITLAVLTTPGAIEGYDLPDAEAALAAASANTVTILDDIINKFFVNIREEGGKVLGDRNMHYYDQFASTENGKVGAGIISEALVIINPQINDPDSDLATLLDGVEAAVAAGDMAEADRIMAATAGASLASTGAAFAGDVERQMTSIRNRTTTMGVNQYVINEDMPYFNAWINAEGNSNELDGSGTKSGYKLDNWGGTVGMDIDFTPSLTAGLAVSSMYGDFTADGPDRTEGDIDTCYISAFARIVDSAWTHTFVGTYGQADMSLTRTNGAVVTKGDTEGTAFGLMYELGYVIPLAEDGSTCLQPVFNVAYRHTNVDGFTEHGSNAALKVGSQTYDTITFGAGARLQTIIGENLYNRASLLELRALVKVDAGDRGGEVETMLATGTYKGKVKSEEYGAVGLELGAGLNIPLGAESGTLFIDGGLEVRSGYTDINGTVGWRINF